MIFCIWFTAVAFAVVAVVGSISSQFTMPDSTGGSSCPLGSHCTSQSLHSLTLYGLVSLCSISALFNRFEMPLHPDSALVMHYYS